MNIESLMKISSEKYKYLFMSEFKKEFELFEIVVTDLTSEEYSVDISGDYLKSCDGHASDLSYMLQNIDEKLMSFLYKFPINPQTKKIDPTYKGVIVNDGVFINFDYKLDELHKFTVWYRINFHDN